MTYTSRIISLSRWFRWRGLVVGLLLSVLVSYGVSNLWLSTSWATGIAKNKLKGRTGMDWEIGGMTWSPWNGMTVRDVKVLQSAVLGGDLTRPALRIDRVRVQPYWKHLVRGRLQLRDVFIESPRAEISVELLEVLAAAVVRDQVSPAVVPSQGLPLDLPDAPIAEVKPDPPKPVSPPVKPSPPIVSATPVRPVRPERPPAGLPMNLHIHGGSLTLFSTSKGVDLVRLDGVDFDMPLWGEDSKGVLDVDSIKVLGMPDVQELQETLVWKRPYLQWGNPSLKVEGLELQANAQLGLGGRTGGVRVSPFGVDLILKPQKLNGVKGLDRIAMQLDAEKVYGRFRCSGILQRPLTWRADTQWHGENIRLKEAHGGHDVVFDDMVVPAAFRRGVLRWGGVSLIGEDLSVLGNGQVSARDGVLSVTRLVVSPEVSEMVRRGLNGAGLVHTGTAWWKNLDTPDRKVRDFQVSGSLMNPVVDVGSRGEELPVKEIVKTTIQFIRGEMKEEGKVLLPIPIDVLTAKP
jgi:hypothetical protein